MTAIETRYHGPTNTRGSRISVQRMDDPKRPERRSFAYRDELSSEENHRHAAELYVRTRDGDAWRTTIWIAGATHRGYVFVQHTSWALTIMPVVAT